MTRSDYLNLAAEFLSRANNMESRKLTENEKGSIADCKGLISSIELHTKVRSKNSNFDGHGFYLSTH